MPMPDHSHALRIPFRLQLGPDKSLDRFVYAYVIFGEQIVVIDTGVAGSAKTILDCIRASLLKARSAWIRRYKTATFCPSVTATR